MTPADSTQPATPSPALPTMVVIGAMKCGTTALHDQLARHPEVGMSDPKELNFFNGPSTPPHGRVDEWWRTGQWHRGVSWYAARFDGRCPVRGESSPAYTSPSFPEVPERMASVLPEARLVYLVRDPVERALSQWAHHRREGQEARPAEEALLDPDSHYLARSRYHERLRGFLRRFPRNQLLVVVQERLRERPVGVLAEVLRHVGADPGRAADLTAGPAPAPRRHQPDGLRQAFLARISDDLAALRALLDDDLEEWQRCGTTT